jgi:hypothetical protein
MSIGDEKTSIWVEKIPASFGPVFTFSFTETWNKSVHNGGGGGGLGNYFNSLKLLISEIFCVSLDFFSLKYGLYLFILSLETQNGEQVTVVRHSLIFNRLQ